MWQFQWPLQQGVVQLNTHMLAGFCISTQEGRLPPVDVETTIQDVAEYNKFHTSHWSVKIDLSLLDVLGLPSPVALWIKEENFLRFLWSLHHKIEIGGKRPTIPQFISPKFFAFCVTSSIFHLGSSFIRGKVQVSDYSPFTLGLHTSVSIVFWWFLEDADVKLSDS